MKFSILMGIMRSPCMIGSISTEKSMEYLKADFQWGWIPFDIMKTYAAMDAVVTFIVL